MGHSMTVTMTGIVSILGMMIATGAVNGDHDRDSVYFRDYGSDGSGHKTFMLEPSGNIL